VKNQKQINLHNQRS